MAYKVSGRRAAGQAPHRRYISTAQRQLGAAGGNTANLLADIGISIPAHNASSTGQRDRPAAVCGRRVHSSSDTRRGWLRYERVNLACRGGDAPQRGLNGGRFIVPDVGGEMASDAVLVDRRRPLQRLLATGSKHD